ncbi:MAG TPA: non-canonical purine NTP pyrophosphatase [Candidatus Binataceae bacterium]|nr:non-canonical purine NTP pyrophosphatase [Candidatus Binataceae bacterium]
MTKLLIASTNPAKLAEYKRLLADFALEPISLREAGIEDQPEETGISFAENAILKARYYFARSQIATLADDGGLEIDALGGEPGVRSHRWLGDVTNPDHALVAEVIRRMEHIADDRRSARLRNALALVYRIGGELREHVTEGTLDGVIARAAYPVITPGFPYRSVLLMPDRGCFLAELSEEEQARMSQRRIAIERARSCLAEIAAAV